VKITHIRSTALGITLSLLVILSVLYYWPIQEPFHPLNTDWNGCSEIGTAVNNTALLFSFDQPIPNGSVLAIIGPSRPFSNSDSAFIRHFLESNGTVLLADDFGTGNELLKDLNVSVRFADRPLADIYYYSRSPIFPLVSDFSPSTYTTNVSVVILDHPSFLEIGNSSQVTTLASSSPFSFIDAKGNGRPAANDSIRSYPVMAHAYVGTGSLVLISDSSVFINEIVGLYDNMRLFENIIDMGDGSTVFDVSHLANAPLSNTRITLRNALEELTGFVRESIYIQALLVAFVLLVSLPYELFKLIKRREKSDSHVLYTAQ
jgi:hypothetical protein